jgi:hypothetical protein
MPKLPLQPWQTISFHAGGSLKNSIVSFLYHMETPSRKWKSDTASRLMDACSSDLGFSFILRKRA